MGTSPVRVYQDDVYTFFITISPSYLVNVTKLAIIRDDPIDGLTPLGVYAIDTPRRWYATIRIRPRADMNVRFSVMLDGPGATGYLDVYNESWRDDREYGRMGEMPAVEVSATIRQDSAPPFREWAALSGQHSQHHPGEAREWWDDW
jgi:hypothetical protein